MRPRRGSALSVSALNADRYESKRSTRLDQARNTSEHRARTATNIETPSLSVTLAGGQEAQFSAGRRKRDVRHKCANMRRTAPSRSAAAERSSVGKDQYDRPIYTDL